MRDFGMLVEHRSTNLFAEMERLENSINVKITVNLMREECRVGRREEDTSGEK